MTNLSQNSKSLRVVAKQDRVAPTNIEVLGISFQAFECPGTEQAVFSQAGTARGLEMAETTARRLLLSEAFKLKRGKEFSPAKILTTINSNPISVVTKTDLIALVAIAAERGYPVAKAMSEASFPILLQQCVDQAFGIKRDVPEYLEAGTQLRKALQGKATPKEVVEYKGSYHSLTSVTFESKRGVRGLCKINRAISAMAVIDADVRRAVTRNWRNKCTGEELSKITIGNSTVCRAIEAGVEPEKAYERIEAAFKLLDAPF